MRILHRTVFVSLEMLGRSLQALVVAFVLSRGLDVEAYGTYQQIWLYYNLIVQIFAMGVPASMLFFIPRLPVERHAVFVRQSLLMLAGVGLVFGLATASLAGVLGGAMNNPALPGPLRMFALYPALALPASLASLWLVAIGRPHLGASLAWIQTALTAGFVWLAVWLHHSVEAVVVAVIAAMAVSLAITLLLVIRQYGWRGAWWSKGVAREQLGYSVPLGLAASIGGLSKQLDRIVVSLSLTPAAYGVYVNGAFELPVVGLFTGALTTVLVPEFARLLKDQRAGVEVWRMWNQVAERTALVLFPLCVFLMLFAVDVIILLFSERYRASAGVFTVYLLTLPVRITQFGALLRAAGRTGWIMWLSVGQVALGTLLCFVLLRLFGMMGAAAGYVLLTYAAAAACLVLIRRLTGRPLRQSMPWRRLGVVAGASVLAIAGALPALLLAEAGALRLAAGAAGYAAVYWLIAGAMGLQIGHEIRAIASATRTLTRPGTP